MPTTPHVVLLNADGNIDETVPSQAAAKPTANDPEEAHEGYEGDHEDDDDDDD